MKELLTDTYKEIYKKIKNKRIAFLSTVLYLALLTFLILKGSFMMLKDVKELKIIPIFFTYPLGFIIYILLFFIYYMLMPSKYEMSKQKKQEKNHMPILVLTGVAIISCLYMYLWDKVKF